MVAGAGHAEPLAGHPYYRKVKDVNAGTFGFVQLAEDIRTGEEVAVKFMERGEGVTKYVEREIKNHRILVHPHIIHFKEVFLTDKYLGIVMEYAAGGDMFEYVAQKEGLHENEARWFFQQLVMAIDYCHIMGVVNRDIKLENALLDKSARPLVKLCDFGYSKHTQEHSQPKSKVGTPGYIAPEVIMNKEYNGESADVWSLGVMLYVMLVGAYPFERPGDKKDNGQLQKMIQRILKVDYVFPSFVEISPECKDLLAQILVKDPEKRITLKQIYRHPWFQIGLPPGVETMNENWHVDLTKLTPTVEEIEAIVKEAQIPAGQQHAKPANVEDDAYLDSMMDKMGA